MAQNQATSKKEELLLYYLQRNSTNGYYHFFHKQVQVGIIKVGGIEIARKLGVLEIMSSALTDFKIFHFITFSLKPSIHILLIFDC